MGKGRYTLLPRMSRCVNRFQYPNEVRNCYFRYIFAVTETCVWNEVRKMSWRFVMMGGMAETFEISSIRIVKIGYFSQRYPIYNDNKKYIGLHWQRRFKRNWRIAVTSFEVRTGGRCRKRRNTKGTAFLFFFFWYRFFIPLVILFEVGHAPSPCKTLVIHVSLCMYEDLWTLRYREIKRPNLKNNLSFTYCYIATNGLCYRSLNKQKQNILCYISINMYFEN